METMTSFGAKLATGGILAVIGLLTIRFVIAVIAGTLGLMAFLLFRVLPLLLVGYIVYRVFKSLTSDKPAYE
jgi:hypothetical protein